MILGSPDALGEVIDSKMVAAPDYSVMEVELRPEKGKRLGLWLMGGKDQGFPPVVESVQSGSPACHASLEVGDQICFVGTTDVSGLPHDDVADLIYQAGSEGVISLKIKRRKADFDVQPFNSDDEDSGIVDNHLYKHISELKSPTLCETSFNSDTKPDNSPEESTMRESSAVETTYISHSTFKPEVAVKKGAKADNVAVGNGKGHAMPLMDNGAYINGAFSPVDMERDVHEMAVDCPVDFQETPKVKPKVAAPQPPSSKDDSAVQQSHPNGRPFGGNAGSARNRNEAMRYQQVEEIRRRDEEIKISREQQFLRGSLRESERLKSLQSKQRSRAGSSTVDAAAANGVAPPAAVFVNEAFDSGDDQLSPTAPKALGPAEVEQCLKVIDRKLGNAGDEVSNLLRSIRRRFEDERFKQILQVHKAVVESSGTMAVSSVSSDSGARVDPTTTSAMQLVKEVAEAVDRLPVNPPAKQLHALLSTEAHLAALIEAHDEVAKLRLHSPTAKLDVSDHEQAGVSPAHVTPRVATPIPPSPEDTEFILRKQAHYNESGLKLVRFQRDGDAPLGATIHNSYDCVLVARIVKGSIVEKSGLLHVGDELLEVNGIEMRGKNVNDVCQILSEVTGLVSMLVMPNADAEQLLQQQQREQPIEEDQIHLRALFSYEPEEDRLCPCRELGVMFRRGEILHVVNAADACWWQASRDGEEDQMPGIVPSKKFWEMREIKRIELEKEMFSDEQNQQTCCLALSKKKLQVDTPEILSYEEVGQYYPQPYRKRPIVLIGPQHVGRHELRRKLLESDPDRFAPAIPHTTKGRESAEIDGRDYHFVDRKHFQVMEQQQQFIECGLYQSNLYGTSVRAVADVISSGRVCILNLNPESIERVRRPELKPYIIFISPPPLAQLQQLTSKLNQRLSDDKLTEIIEAGRKTDVQWGHLFDFVVVNQDIERTYKLIMDEINRLDVEPQWVPSMWLAHPLGGVAANGGSAPGIAAPNEVASSLSAPSSVRGSGAYRERAINASPIASRA